MDAEQTMDNLAKAEGRDSDEIKKLKAEAMLREVVADFNSGFLQWERKFNFGANFDFSYDNEGNKYLKVRDFEPIAVDRPAPNDERVTYAQKVISKALEFSANAMDDKMKSDMTEAAEKAAAKIKDRIETSLQALLTETVSSLDGVVLSSIGVDPLELARYNIYKMLGESNGN